MSGELPLSRPTSLRRDQPAQHLSVEATAAERAAVAKVLGIEGVEYLRLDGALRFAGRDFALCARIEATVSQACVVTDAPVSQRIDVPVERRFVLGPVPEVPDVEVDPEADDIEHLEAPVVDLGQVMVEELSLALDPYPRAADADAVVARYAPDEARPSSPFAVLAQRRLDA